MLLNANLYTYQIASSPIVGSRIMIKSDLTYDLESCDEMSFHYYIES